MVSSKLYNHNFRRWQVNQEKTQLFKKKPGRHPFFQQAKLETPDIVVLSENHKILFNKGRKVGKNIKHWLSQGLYSK